MRKFIIFPIILCQAGLTGCNTINTVERSRMKEGWVTTEFYPPEAIYVKPNCPPVIYGRYSHSSQRHIDKDEGLMGYMTLTDSQARAAGLYEGQTDYSNLDFSKITDGRRSQISSSLPSGYVFSYKLDRSVNKRTSPHVVGKKDDLGPSGYIC